MLSKTEVEARVKGLLVSELNRRVAQAGRRLPTNCKHNHRQPLDTRRLVAGGNPNPNYNKTSGKKLPVIGLCMYGSDSEEWPGNICEDREDALGCSTFNNIHTSNSVYQNFLEDLSSKKLSGELLTLFWLLEEDPTPKHLPWWKRLWARYFLKVDYEPINSPSPEKILEIARSLTSSGNP